MSVRRTRVTRRRRSDGSTSLSSRLRAAPSVSAGHPPRRLLPGAGDRHVGFGEKLLLGVTCGAVLLARHVAQDIAEKHKQPDADNRQEDPADMYVHASPSRHANAGILIRMSAAIRCDDPFAPPAI